MFHGFSCIFPNSGLLNLVICYTKFQFMMDHCEIHSCLCSKYFAQWLMVHGLAYGVSNISTKSSLFDPYHMLYEVSVYDGSLGDPLLFMQ